jgi:hypothetical protein
VTPLPRSAPVDAGADTERALEVAADSSELVHSCELLLSEFEHEPHPTEKTPVTMQSRHAIYPPPLPEHEP